MRLEPAQLDRIPIAGIKAASQVWIRHLDLDRDGKEDAVVTVASPPELGPYWRNWRSATHVFRGQREGRFGGYGAASLWFSVVTREAQDHVRYGDSEVRRLFRLVHERGAWVVEIRQFDYGNNGGEARDRLMSLRSASSRRLAISELENGTYAP